MNWIYVMMEIFYQTRRSGKLLGVGTKTCNEIPNNGWNMAYNKMEGRQIMRAN